MKKLQPVYKNYIWGGNKLESLFNRSGIGGVSESWEVSVHPDGESYTDEGTLKEYLSAHSEALPSDMDSLPVLIKYIDAAQKLSVQVHPNDEYARRVEGDNGKTEMWYIISAEAGAGIYCGFKRDVSKEEFLKNLAEGTVEELLNFIPVKAGDCYLIEAGTVHAIGAGCVICEVQQSSNVTYRVYDYNRKDSAGNVRPLHVEKAMDVINFKAFCDTTGSGEFASSVGGRIRLLTVCRYFRCRELLLDGVYTEKNGDSFTAINVIEGTGVAGGIPFAAGDSFFVPRGKEIVLQGSGKIILTDVPARRYNVGIDLGGTFIKCGILDDRGNIVAKTSIPTGKERHYSEIAADMAKAVRQLSEQAGIEFAQIESVGIGSPGTVDSAKGVIVYSNNIAWENVPLGESLQNILGKPVYVTNDANAAAFGESTCGAAKDYRSMILITLGTGVGGGVVLDGKLFEGNRSAGAEIGHEVIRLGGEKCTCGRRGCFEAYASATALIRQTKQSMQKNRDSKMWDLCKNDIENVDGKTAFDGMRLEDSAAKRVVSKYISYLAAGIVNLANSYRPEIILLGGGICKEGETLLKPLRKLLRRELYGGDGYAPVLLDVATLGNNAGICGAAEYAKRRSRDKA